MDTNTGPNFNYLLKYIIVGDSSVGKSNILLRYAHMINLMKNSEQHRC